MTEKSRLTILHSIEFGDREEAEIEEKGFYEHAIVSFQSGKQYSLFFYDAERIVQDFDFDTQSGKPCLAEVGIVLIPKVNLSNMEKAVNYLAQTSYFDGLRPITGE